MRLIEQLCTASTVLSFASASPVEQTDIKLAFTVHQSMPKPFIQSGPAAVLSTYHKFKAPAPRDVLAAAAANDGVVTASPTLFDTQYLSPVTIGGQNLNLDLDTGSADLWVFSSELSAFDAAGHQIYDPSLSSTAVRKDGYTWRISYSDGSSASGDVYTDTVNIGGTAVADQAVQVASQISAQFQRVANLDGVLGLSFSIGNTVKPTKQLTFFDNAKSSLSAPLFTVDLKKGVPGTYNFGFIDDSKHTGPIAYVPVNSARGFWGFSAQGYAVGNYSFQSASIDAIADTGSTLLYLPDSVVSAYYGKILAAFYSSTQGGYIFPCSTTLPTITIRIGSYDAVIPGPFVNYAPVDHTGKTCFGGIQSHGGMGFSVFGDVFLKSQFVVFDDGNSPRLGFAAKPL